MDAKEFKESKLDTSVNDTIDEPVPRPGSPRPRPHPKPRSRQRPQHKFGFYVPSPESAVRPMAAQMDEPWKREMVGQWEYHRRRRHDEDIPPENQDRLDYVLRQYHDNIRTVDRIPNDKHFFGPHVQQLLTMPISKQADATLVHFDPSQPTHERMPYYVKGLGYGMHGQDNTFDLLRRIEEEWQEEYALQNPNMARRRQDIWQTARMRFSDEDHLAQALVAGYRHKQLFETDLYPHSLTYKPYVPLPPQNPINYTSDENDTAIKKLLQRIDESKRRSHLSRPLSSHSMVYGMRNTPEEDSLRRKIAGFKKYEHFYKPDGKSQGYMAAAKALVDARDYELSFPLMSLTDPSSYRDLRKNIRTEAKRLQQHRQFVDNLPADSVPLAPRPILVPDFTKDTLAQIQRRNQTKLMSAVGAQRMDTVSFEQNPQQKEWSKLASQIASYNIQQWASVLTGAWTHAKTRQHYIKLWDHTYAQRMKDYNAWNMPEAMLATAWADAIIEETESLPHDQAIQRLHNLAIHPKKLNAATQQLFRDHVIRGTAPHADWRAIADETFGAPMEKMTKILNEQDEPGKRHRSKWISRENLPPKHKLVYFIPPTSKQRTLFFPPVNTSQKSEFHPILFARDTPSNTTKQDRIFSKLSDVGKQRFRRAVFDIRHRRYTASIYPTTRAALLAPRMSGGQREMAVQGAKEVDKSMKTGDFPNMMRITEEEIANNKTQDIKKELRRYERLWGRAMERMYPYDSFGKARPPVPPRWQNFPGGIEHLIPEDYTYTTQSIPRLFNPLSPQRSDRSQRLSRSQSEQVVGSSIRGSSDPMQPSSSQLQSSTPGGPDPAQPLDDEGRVPSASPESYPTQELEPSVTTITTPGADNRPPPGEREGLSSASQAGAQPTPPAQKSKIGGPSPGSEQVSPPSRGVVQSLFQQLPSQALTSPTSTPGQRSGFSSARQMRSDFRDSSLALQRSRLEHSLKRDASRRRIREIQEQQDMLRESQRLRRARYRPPATPEHFTPPSSATQSFLIQPPFATPASQTSVPSSGQASAHGAPSTATPLDPRYPLFTQRSPTTPSFAQSSRGTTPSTSASIGQIGQTDDAMLTPIQPRHLGNAFSQFTQFRGRKAPTASRPSAPGSGPHSSAPPMVAIPQAARGIRPNDDDYKGPHPTHPLHVPHATSGAAALGPVAPPPTGHAPVPHPHASTGAPVGVAPPGPSGPSGPPLGVAPTQIVIGTRAGPRFLDEDFFQYLMAEANRRAHGNVPDGYRQYVWDRLYGQLNYILMNTPTLTVHLGRQDYAIKKLVEALELRHEKNLPSVIDKILAALLRKR